MMNKPGLYIGGKRFEASIVAPKSSEARVGACVYFGDPLRQENGRPVTRECELG